MIAIAPLSTDLLRLLAIEDPTNWLDDIYLNSSVSALNISSRFTESEDHTRCLDSFPPSRHIYSLSTIRPLNPGTTHRTNLINENTIFIPLTTVDSSATHIAPTTVWRTAFSIVMLLFSVCPPPHNPRTNKKSHQLGPSSSPPPTENT